ncbi:hypothetical protein [Flavobacterium reichenbachii]|uniref:Uncharacterized protein n=1 Tax=Flavobacterium reichenbachii TaxID=362418 RepID=A0A085ZQF0_9FLAO|nr:hypothetical protein [Flavobacterium reichenbachii]KFF06664.1 hypothetical protein IW19_14615 [Flavobacterium reichenbachii]OXB18732.1 hypothetical protein B0A68_01585 [Flavobacterium reichenbachii]
MKKIIVALILIVLSFASGFWVNQNFYSDRKTEETENEKLQDTAEINRQKRLENLSPTYTIRGGLPDYKDKYRYVIDRWYNFSFRVTAGGCTNQDEYPIDEAQNHKTDSILKKRIGINWRERFEKSVDSLYKIDSLSINIAENNSEIKKLTNKKLAHKSKDYVSYKCYPTTSDNVKIVSIEWEGKIYKDSTKVSYLRAIVDLKAKRVIEIEKTEKEGSNFMF